MAAKPGDGFGIMLGDGLGCYDLDHVITNYKLAPWVREFVAKIPEPIIYIERSLSRTGLHIFIEAAEGAGHRSDGVERYTRARFIRMTGDTYTIT